jgi:CIC family chloride channel protein
MLTRQDGLELPSLEEQREEAVLRVEDAMRPPAGPVLSVDETVDLAYRRIQQAIGDIFLVRLSSTGWTTVTRDAVRRVWEDGQRDAPLGTVIPRRRLPHLHPDLPLEVALRYAQKAAIVPVINRADFRKLEGVISQEDVLYRYKLVEREPLD